MSIKSDDLDSRNNKIISWKPLKKSNWNNPSNQLTTESIRAVEGKTAVPPGT